MAIRPKEIDEASAEERRAFVTRFLNLELSGTASDDEVLTLIKQAQPQSTIIFVEDEISVDNANEPAIPDVPLTPEQQAKADKLNLRPEEKGRPTAGSLGEGDPRVLVEIPMVETDDQSGRLDVMVGVNGRAWQLRRGKPLNIPLRVFIALENAVTDVVRHEVQGGNEADIQTVTRPAKRIPFQVLERPSEEAVKAWHERTDALFCA